METIRIKCFALKHPSYRSADQNQHDDLVSASFQHRYFGWCHSRRAGREGANAEADPPTFHYPVQAKADKFANNSIDNFGAHTASNEEAVHHNHSKTTHSKSYQTSDSIAD
mmetsp:Transcript_2385/g.5108  ORF Transcript_2385/g.5108 Transcript_2385/m.5108 type:complete len:111 (+) Transcript_2385:53-385(+)